MTQAVRPPMTFRKWVRPLMMQNEHIVSVVKTVENDLMPVFLDTKYLRLREMLIMTHSKDAEDVTGMTRSTGIEPLVLVSKKVDSCFQIWYHYVIMDYIGSKVKLNEWLFEDIKDACPKGVFMDGCCGSGVVSRYAAKQGYHVVANDIMAFPKILVNGSIGLAREQKQQVEECINELNELEGEDGFFFKNYATKAKYFSKANARRIDAIRFDIGLVKDSKIRDALLYCGLEALSRVSNTAGTHGAYLKILKDRAKEKYTLRPEEQTDGVIESYSEDVIDLLQTYNKEDILYIDPPYNTRQYPNNYHLYETFVRYDNPVLTGKTKLRDGWQEEGGSQFCSKKTCMNFLKDIVDATVAKHIFVSYSSDGLLTKKEICDAFAATVKEKDQRRYKADDSDKREYNDKPLFEYLFHIKK